MDSSGFGMGSGVVTVDGGLRVGPRSVAPIDSVAFRGKCRIDDCDMLYAGEVGDICDRPLGEGCEAVITFPVRLASLSSRHI